LATILIYAIVNTLFNTILIGITLWAFNFSGLYGETKFELLHCFVFSSLISAVDPVAVIATFVEIGVNDMLYIIVFGESLLNDGVAVVLYRIFATFSEQGSENVEVVDVFLGISSFFVVALGGTLIGIIFGLIGSFTTKYTEHARILEPLIVITYSYLAYLTADMCSTSGILALVSTFYRQLSNFILILELHFVACS
jgi:sodium/hydrogen exchanger-like protein 3